MTQETTTKQRGGSQDGLAPWDEYQELDPGRFGLASRPTEDVDVARDEIVRCELAGFNVLGTAVARLDAIPPNHTFGIKLVRLPIASLRKAWRVFSEACSRKGNKPATWMDGSPSGTTWWWITETGKPAPTLAALQRLAGLAGVRDVPAGCGRVDDCRTPHYWRYRHQVKIKGLDGQWREVVREKELDLGAPVDHRGKEWPISRLVRAREHGAAMAQSKAVGRAIRAALGIPGSYSWEDASKPFAIPSLIWVGSDDPEVRRMVAAVEMGIAQEYLQASQPELVLDGRQL